jgi:hypothetical protein
VPKPKEPSEQPRNPSPSQSQPPSPSPSGAAASSRGSAAGSRRSEPPPFVADVGPEFDPEAAPPPTPPIRDAEPVQLVEWEEDTICALLTLQGRGMHAAIGVAEQDWRHTELDLAAIAPPLTRICNRYEPIAQLAKFSDPMTLAFALGAYGVRSLEERAAVIRELEEEADTRPIAPINADVPQQPPPPPAAPAAAPPPAPRQAASFPSQTPGPPPPMQPTQGPAQPPPPRPAEAEVNPTELEWQVGSA